MELVYQKRSLARGPRVVAIGGGTGLSTLLRGLKETTSNITAVVTVADDGGSSGKLRQELGIAPVGDIRNCITALADAEPTMTRLLQYRFPADEARARRAWRATPSATCSSPRCRTSRVTSRRASGCPTGCSRCAARSCPVAPVPLTLHAELADGQQLEGQSRIMRSRGIRRVWVAAGGRRGERGGGGGDPLTRSSSCSGRAACTPACCPACWCPASGRRWRATSGLRVYVCNVATQPGETEGYTLSEHLAALHAHGVGSLVDVVLANDNPRARRQPADYPAAPVRIDIDRRPGDARAW